MPSNIEVSIEGFTGPLDLLCHLVESRQMQASKIKVAQLVRIYGAYLSKTRNASAEIISEFFFMAAGLLLQKVLSLLPSDKENVSSGFEDSDESYDVISEEELLARMSRFSPYRKATSILIERKGKQDRKFRRISLHVADASFPKYELGDLYNLSKLWWSILAAHRNENNSESIWDEDESWDGVPESLPDEARIQTRIDEITEKLRKYPVLLLSSLIEEQKLLSTSSVSAIVVTLLALLEMCRMKKISVFQEELFGEVRINAAFSDSIAY
ncbi:MAG: segregation/condensation protein A [Synergistaceae bacterium]|nr:segregation/condensation protein A [Synergistaceae bacterium]